MTLCHIDVFNNIFLFKIHCVGFLHIAHKITPLKDVGCTHYDLNLCHDMKNRAARMESF